MEVENVLNFDNVELFSRGFAFWYNVNLLLNGQAKFQVFFLSQISVVSLYIPQSIAIFENTELEICSVLLRCETYILSESYSDTATKLWNLQVRILNLSLIVPRLVNALRKYSSLLLTYNLIDLDFPQAIKRFSPSSVYFSLHFQLSWFLFYWLFGMNRIIQKIKL